jgi:hypothetical protein
VLLFLVEETFLDSVIGAEEMVDRYVKSSWTNEGCSSVLPCIDCTIEHMLDVDAVCSLGKKMPCPNSQQILYQHPGKAVRPVRKSDASPNRASLQGKSSPHSLD